MKAVCSSVCHNLNTTRYSYILPALPPTKKCTPTSAVMPWVVTSEQAHKQCWTRKQTCLMCIESLPPPTPTDLQSERSSNVLSWSQWPRRTTSLPFALQRPRAAHSLWAHLLTRAQRSARGGICGDQAATFGDHPRGSDEAFVPSATTVPWSCWRHGKGQTDLFFECSFVSLIQFLYCEWN